MRQGRYGGGFVERETRARPRHWLLKADNR